jgi:hypothetical protein
MQEGGGAGSPHQWEATLLSNETRGAEIQEINPGEVRELLWRYLDDRVQTATEARALIKAANARIGDIRKGLRSADPHRQVREPIGR